MDRCERHAFGVSKHHSFLGFAFRTFPSSVGGLHLGLGADAWSQWFELLDQVSGLVVLVGAEEAAKGRRVCQTDSHGHVHRHDGRWHRCRVQDVQNSVFTTKQQKACIVSLYISM